MYSFCIYTSHDHFPFELINFEIPNPQNLIIPMLALSPPVFPPYGWPLEDPIGHEHIYFSRESEKTINSIDNANFFQPQPPQILELDHSASFTYHSGDPNMVKKLNHNASERHRRKKMNSLYSSLRSLLPEADQMVCIEHKFSLLGY